MKITLACLLLFGIVVANLNAAEDQIHTDQKDATKIPEADPAHIEFFEQQIRPLLAINCFRCHGENKKKIEGGLILNSHDGILAGGDSGPVLVPGKPDKSLLVRAIRYQEDGISMPPQQKLAESDIAALTKWVEMGAPWPKAEQKNQSAEKENKTADYHWNKFRTEHWSFRPIVAPDVPSVKEMAWVKNDIDRFVLKRLEAEKLTPNSQADKRTLIRRAYLDLLGLPPTPEQVQNFLNNEQPDAFEQVVDKLLQSEHYGERWGRHWLDVARYSDGLGGFLDGANLPNAWRYRDWVVQALNKDMPYDEFVKRQIAGDVSKSNPDPIATGFFAVGPTYNTDGNDPLAILQAQAETLGDRVDTLSRAFLGLTVACARCHDHKFDPIPTKDYYAIAGVFRNTTIEEMSVASSEIVAAYQLAQERLRSAQQELNEFTKAVEGTNTKEKRAPTAEEQIRIDELKHQFDLAKKAAAEKPPAAHVLKESGHADMNIALRGDLSKKGEIAPRRFLQILVGENAPRFTDGSGRRELAEAIVSKDNPLTARVIVNRVWKWHFGEALVRTPGNFGILGEKPTHPELLDMLAIRFMEHGWSLKWLHREIMLSATWQMSSAYAAHQFRIDGDNRLLWRMNPRKLEVENWRDSMLAVTAELDSTIGGEPTEQILDSRRRSLYAKISRSGDHFESDAFFRTFDSPAAQATADSRSITTVPQQYLFMMNNPFMLKRATALAKLLEPLGDDETRIRSAYERLYGRPPEERELTLGKAFLKDHPEYWPKYAQVLLSAHEFLQIQ